MVFRKAFLFIGLIISVLCLVVGYGIAGQWVGAILAILVGAGWLFARKYSDSQLPLVWLLVSVGFAVAGMLMGAPALLMIFGSATALAVWDLLLLDSALGNHISVEETRHYENNHLQSLLLALGCGLLGVFLGNFLKIQIPFIVMILLIAFVIFALDRIWGEIKKTGKT